jgi:hypothetical protein
LFAVVNKMLWEAFRGVFIPRATTRVSLVQRKGKHESGRAKRNAATRSVGD